MMRRHPVPVLAVRLDADGRPWRLLPEGIHELRLINAPVARAPGEIGVPYSFTALPGRYLMALLHILQSEHGSEWGLVLNPALDVQPDELSAMRADFWESGVQNADSTADVILFLDYDEQILGYGWSSKVLEVASLPFDDLRFLSGVDAAVDAKLLSKLGFQVQKRMLRTPPRSPRLPALMQFRGMGAISRYSAASRLAMLHAGKNETLAVVTHHAGDVLLAVKAIQYSRTPVTGFVVHEAYADVVRLMAPDLRLIEVKGPLPARGEVTSPAHALNDEILYFERFVLPILPDDVSFLFMRPCRGYMHADYTLASQIAFGLGQSDDELNFPAGALLEAPDPFTQQYSSLPQVRGRRILLHFDGGWPLKVYPPEWQRELIDALRSKGFEPSVLGNTFPDVPSHAFTDLAALKSLLQEHDALIGMDSFPCHFASQALKLPTLCLYASTRVENLAHAASDYLALEQGLTCSPCGERYVCPRFGGTACRNFVPPAAVAELMEQCLIRA
ncbi:hypothetical protein H0A70_18275 [Alcaligenaceae bacterium]|nr:hypothetical protein [Alcaligenaceae bacterium]